MKMKLTEQETGFLAALLKRELDAFEKDKKIVRDEKIAFVIGEEKYDGFLKGILKKLR